MLADLLPGGVSELADEHDLGFANSKVNVKQLLDAFLKSRRQGISPHTIAYYKQCLTPFLTFYRLTPQSITEFISSLNCNAGGQHVLDSYFIPHFMPEIPNAETHDFDDLVKNDPYQIIDTLRILAKQGIFKGTCPVCKDRQ